MLKMQGLGGFEEKANCPRTPTEPELSTELNPLLDLAASSW